MNRISLYIRINEQLEQNTPLIKKNKNNVNLHYLLAKKKGGSWQKAILKQKDEEEKRKKREIWGWCVTGQRAAVSCFNKNINMTTSRAPRHTRVCVRTHAGAAAVVRQ